MLYLTKFLLCLGICLCSNIVYAQFNSDEEFLKAFQEDKNEVKHTISTILASEEKNFNALYFDILFKLEEYKIVQQDLYMDELLDESTKQQELQYLQKEIVALHNQIEFLIVTRPERLDVRRLNWNIYYQLNSDLRHLEFTLFKFLEDSKTQKHQWILGPSETPINDINLVADFFKREISLLDLDLSLQDKNLSFLEKLAQYLPEYYFTWQLMAQYYMGQEDIRSAYVFLLRAYTINNKDKYVLNALESVCTRLGHNSEAAMYRNQAEKL